MNTFRYRTSRRALLAFGCFVIGNLLGVQPAKADGFTVNSTADIPDASPGNGICETAPGNGQCTLRAAIQEANASLGSDTITLPAANYLLTRTGSPDDNAFRGDLDVTDQLSIIGESASNTIINGNSVGERIFHHLGPGFTLQNLTVRNGAAGSSDGGGIFNSVGDLNMYNSLITNNSSQDGGGIFNASGSVYIENSIVSENIVEDSGGGIRSFEGDLILVNSRVTGNTADRGGGIANYGGDARVENSSIDNNTASLFAGGVLAFYGVSAGSVKFINTTISSNRSNGSGGGIVIDSTSVELFNVTIAHNIADADNNDSAQGGGIDFFNTIGTVTLQNTILANNSHRILLLPTFAPDDCKGTLISADYNLVEELDGCTLTGTTTNTWTGIDPLLGPLADNGGAAPTHALMPGSPAIERGNPGGCKNHLNGDLLTDQRGFRRPADGDQNGWAVCDIGAFEAGLKTYLPFVVR
jgi:CSLREA domain-containing protein